VPVPTAGCKALTALIPAAVPFLQTTGGMRAPLDTIAYAKSPAHERFLRTFEGRTRGRYCLAYLVGLEVLGGTELRRRVEAELGNPRYQGDEWHPLQDMILIFDRAMRANVSLFRLGELVVPTYKRANPEPFEGKTVVDMFGILERGYRSESPGTQIASEVDPANRVGRIYRVDAAAPCEYFRGVVSGALKTFGQHTGSAVETTCQWEGAARCAYEGRWE
jgi:predicted hydrocarbon binding protein